MSQHNPSPLRRLRLENLESRYLLAGNVFQNPLNNFDVNHDQYVNIGDARDLFSHLLSGVYEDVSHYLDVNGDGLPTTQDLREVFGEALLQAQSSVHHALDQVESTLMDLADSSPVVHDALNDLGSLLGNSSLLDVVDSLVHDGINEVNDVWSNIDSFVQDYQQTVDDLYSDIHLLAQDGLNDVQDALDEVSQSVSDAWTILDGQIGSELNGHLNLQYLTQHVDDLLTSLGVPDLTNEFVSYIEGIHNDPAEIPESATDLVNQLYDGTLNLDINLPDLSHLNGNLSDLQWLISSSLSDVNGIIHDSLSDLDSILNGNLPDLGSILNGNLPDLGLIIGDALGDVQYQINHILSDFDSINIQIPTLDSIISDALSDLMHAFDEAGNVLSGAGIHLLEILDYGQIVVTDALCQVLDCDD